MNKERTVKGAVERFLWDLDLESSRVDVVVIEPWGVTIELHPDSRDTATRRHMPMTEELD